VKIKIPKSNGVFIFSQSITPPQAAGFEKGPLATG